MNSAIKEKKIKNLKKSKQNLIDMKFVEIHLTDRVLAVSYAVFNYSFPWKML